MIEIIAFILYSVGLVAIGMFLGNELRKFIESEDKE